MRRSRILRSVVDGPGASRSNMNMVASRVLLLIFFFIYGTISSATGKSTSLCGLNKGRARATLELSNKQELQLSKTLKSVVIPPSPSLSFWERSFQLDERASSFWQISNSSELKNFEPKVSSTLTITRISGFSYRLAPFSAYEILLI